MLLIENYTTKVIWDTDYLRETYEPTMYYLMRWDRDLFDCSNLVYSPVIKHGKLKFPL